MADLRCDVAIAHDCQVVACGGCAADLTGLAHGRIAFVRRRTACSGIFGVPDSFDVDLGVVASPSGREDLSFEF